MTDTLPEMSDERIMEIFGEPDTSCASEEDIDRRETIRCARAILSEGTASLMAENERLRAERDDMRKALYGARELLAPKLAERDQLATQLRACEPVAWRDVLAERRRQVEVEGWPPEHDDEHANGELSFAAAAYATRAAMNQCERLEDDDQDECPTYWPWSPEWWKPAEPRRMLIKAGALILAEIERFDRASQGATPSGQQAPRLARSCHRLR